MRFLILSMLLASQAVADEATIRPGDTILLKAAIPKDDEEHINKYHHVDKSGCIRLPYLDKVTVGGLTAAGAARQIEEAYTSRAVFAHPSVTVSIEGPDPAVAEVRVSGPVQHPGKYKMTTPATIEEALALAGGWSGSGEIGIPAKFCGLTHDVDGEVVYTRVRVHIDRKTKQIVVLDEPWKSYHLVEGDQISLAQVLL